MCWKYRDQNIIPALGVQSLTRGTDESTELQYNGLSIETEVSRMCHSLGWRMVKIVGLRENCE